MKNNGWFSRFLNQQPATTGFRRTAGVAVMLLATAGIAVAQASSGPLPELGTLEGYSTHHSMDIGGRIANKVGSGQMYNTLVNLQSGPRVLGENFEMHALPGKKTGVLDDLNLFGSGFGGDPNNLVKVDFSKGRVYEFSGMFRRDRLYSDYDLLGNPNLTTGNSILIGPSAAPTGSLPWGQNPRSSVMFNTVRRMTDVHLTVAPFATFSYRFGYNHGTMEGPSLSPSYTIMKYDALLRQYQRNGSDDFLGAIDWKPSQLTKISLEVQANHYKSDTFFTLDPTVFNVQEADGTPAYLGNWDSQTPYGLSACNTASMGTGNTTTILSANPNGKPIINPACAVVTSYSRTQPIRTWTPTETLRLQSSAIKNLTMNGSLSYTRGTSDLLSYGESAFGLSGTSRSVIWGGGHATVARQVVNADYGVVWQVTPKVSLFDQVNYNTVHQPGSSIILAPVTQNTPAAATGNATINYSGPLTPGVGALPHGVNGTLTPAFFGTGSFINNTGISWDLSSRAQLSLTYRYSTRKISRGVPHVGDLQETDPVSGELTINENAGVFNAALHPARNWDLNGTVEIGYDDNALTAVSPRQFKQYRLHTIYRPVAWATLTGSFSDRERHNNTNNNEEAVADGSQIYYGPLNHIDFNRIGSVGLVLAPSDRFSFDMNYSFSRVYSATNTCFASGAAANLPGAAALTASGAPDVCPGVFVRGSTTVLTDFHGRDFIDAPTQYGYVGVVYNPTVKAGLRAGYSISAVNGSRFFNDARDVSGSLVSHYDTPYLGLSYAFRPGLIWKADYDYYGYGEGGPSGAPLCSTTVSTTATVSPCTSFSQPTGRTEPTSGLTMPRVFHANNVTLGVHYEF